MRYECVSEIRDKTGLLTYKIKQEHKQFILFASPCRIGRCKMPMVYPGEGC